jgi:hypothetical protein
MEQRINIDINRELWRQLSIRCAELDLLKKDAAEEAIGDWLKKTEEGKEMEDITYTLHDRVGDSYEDLTEEQALAIVKEADLHTGPYGAMGSSIDHVVYEEAEDEITVRAIRYDGRWFEVPRSQNPFISAELGNSSYEEPRDAAD